MLNCFLFFISYFRVNSLVRHRICCILRVFTRKVIYMIKKEKMKTTNLRKNPYMYYMTNWGFIEQVEQSSEKADKQSKTQKQS